MSFSVFISYSNTPRNPYIIPLKAKIPTEAHVLSNLAGLLRPELMFSRFWVDVRPRSPIFMDRLSSYAVP